MAEDVKEMYHMLHLPDRDKPALRFLWNEEEDAQEPDVFQFERTVFGEVSAPSRANYVMRRNAEENGAELWPKMKWRRVTKTLKSMQLATIVLSVEPSLLYLLGDPQESALV